MSLIEYDLFGNKVDKVEIAIKRLQAYEPEKGHPGFFLANSGGKDSTVVRQLAIMAGVRFDAHYSATTVDPPELVLHWWIAMSSGTKKTSGQVGLFD